MRTLRRNLRVCAATWLAAQLVAVVVFAVAPSCCAAHQAALHGDGGHALHGPHDPAGPRRDDPSVPAEQCPMRGAAGDACPMHQAPATAADDPWHSGGPAQGDALRRPAPASDDCVLRAVCNGPTAAMASLSPMPAVLADAPAAPIDSPCVSVEASRIDPVTVPVPHDTPPPRT